MRYKRIHTKIKNNYSKPDNRNRKSGTIAKTGIIVSLIIFISVAIYGFYVYSGLPSVAQLDRPPQEYSSKVYSDDGVLIGQFSVINRSRISIDEAPQQLIDAVIASEDRKFYHHRGIDPDRIVKAAIKNIISFRIREGASTITQQVARNLYLTRDQSLTRKIREAITAVQIERRYSKDQILEMYLNLAFFGNNSYGVAAASKLYFDKSVSELTLPESAFLIGLLPNPTIYNPYAYPERALTRRNIVLYSMAQVGFISENVAKQASLRPLELNDPEAKPDSDIAPHFIEYIRKELSDIAIEYGLDIYRDGLRIHTTLDSRMQRYANLAVEKHLAPYQNIFDRQWNWRSSENQSILKSAIEREIRSHRLYRNAGDDEHRNAVRQQLLQDDSFINDVTERLKTIQTGFIALDPSTGAIKAMVGSSNYRQYRYGLNRTTQISRQPGSAFKPFVYTVAIDNGYPAYYRLANDPVEIISEDGTTWKPANIDGSSSGIVTLREALAKSINIIAVRTLIELAPVQEVVRYANRMGISSHLHLYESLSLGTAEVSPLELTSAYGVFATNGIYHQPTAITRIEDNSGKILLSFIPEGRRVLKAETAYIMTDMLRDVIEYGTGRNAIQFINFPAAGKTGTTQGNADGWFVGYTPDLVAGAWVGFDDRRISLGNLNGQGSRSALPVWARFMNYVYEDPEIGLIPRDFEIPSGVKPIKICPDSYLLASKYCPDYIDEITVENMLPEICDHHQSFFRSVRTFISRLFK